MSRHIAKDSGERADAKRAVIGNRDVMRAALLCRQPQMASGLARDFITKSPQSMSEIGPAHIARQPHAEMTSSLTKWRRITLGRSLSP